MLDIYSINQNSAKSIKNGVFSYDYSSMVSCDDFDIDLPTGSFLHLNLQGGNITFKIGMVNPLSKLIITFNQLVKIVEIENVYGSIDQLEFKKLNPDTKVVITGGHNIEEVIIDEPIHLFYAKDTYLKKLISNTYIEHVIGNFWIIESNKVIKHLITMSNYTIQINNENVINFYGNERHSPNSYIFGKHCVNGNQYVNLDQLLTLNVGVDRNNELVGMVI